MEPGRLIYLQPFAAYGNFAEYYMKKARNYIINNYQTKIHFNNIL